MYVQDSETEGGSETVPGIAPVCLEKSYFVGKYVVKDRLQCQRVQ